ncbi:hypothetical protein [Burkholderia ubonensis]|uniref:hypothetical protein n=1 Tax=Burkholderia ubonensis TaxID=101571 RepID=UPI00075D7CEF|nr:hypothetical protein [Burkholderia ubonensis]AOI68438.1 hypothetical protein WI31_02420 [Burkholderia ubonensis]KUZ19441.1 hypothetical protein WI30_35605 [Burkholderia ubonensis]KUZ23209.1 hypothetical protein WI29_13560 [Burkholderia ubonensis]KUZ31174.1 hypothetical protein WI32_23570 [Burkholderia ubonensis]KUZ53633.1 hypothetical protein WI33_10270 [Burkholderia ubonensis]
MLLRSVPERALAALLGSVASAEVLRENLARLPASIGARSGWILILRKELRKAIQEDVDARTGKRNRLNEIQQQAQRLCNDGFLSTSNILAIDAVFDDLMKRESGRFEFRDEHIQRYAELVSEIDPTVIVAWRLADGDEKAFNAERAVLKATVEQMDTLFVSSRFLNRSFAENHVHLAGISGDDVILSHIVLFLGPKSVAYPSKELGKQAHKNVVRLRRIQELLIAFVEIWTSSGTSSDLSWQEREELLVLASQDDLTSICKSTQRDWQAMDDGLLLGNGDTSYRWMLKELAGAARQSQYKLGWSWLFILLWRSYRDSNATVAMRAVVLQMVAEIMLLRRELIMDGNGLRRFVTTHFVPPAKELFTSNKEWKEKNRREAVRRLFTIAGDKVELKISPRDYNESFTQALAKNVGERMSALRFSQTTNAGHTIAAFDHWHFCLHLNRSFDGEKSRAIRRKKLWAEVKKLKKVFEPGTYWMFQFDDSLKTHPFSPAQFVRGLDVAGDETQWPISTFAPMLRWLREDDPTPTRTLMPTAQGIRIYNPSALHLSIHAGEDYTHPLSGLRHVDETVEFCEMRDGDRLGHALALGIAPDEWLRHHGDVMLSVDEHVDNLVWALRNAIRLEREYNLDLASRVQQRIEARIRRFIPHVSWRSRTMFTPSSAQLYEAWRLRRNCVDLATSLSSASSAFVPELKVGVPDYDELVALQGRSDANSAAGLFLLWAGWQQGRSAIELRDEQVVTVRLTYQRHGHPSRAQQQREKENTPNNDMLMYDHDTPDELEFMAALQDACIERYAQKGLAIETNPSSNVYIGQIETHSDHPIYRWDPPQEDELEKKGKSNRFGIRKRVMPVTINTDDPGIVPTTLRMEYHLMHEAALDRGCTERAADEWTEKIRQRGLATFDLTHGT